MIEESSMTVTRLHPALGATVRGVDLAAPLDPDTARALKQLWQEYHVLVFPGQAITDADQIEFSRNFGELEVLPEPDQRASKHPEIFRISNTDETGRIRSLDDPTNVYLKIVEHWHTDSAYRDIPSFGAVLRALAIPPSGGETRFVNLFLAYEEMPERLRMRIRGRRMRCSYEKTRRVPGNGVRPMSESTLGATPPVYHDLVRRHPERDNRLSLYLSPVNMDGIEGMAANEAEALTSELTEWATQDRFVYAHSWQIGDVLMWDNRCTMHCVLPYDQANHRRIMHRTALAGMEPVVPESPSPL